MSGITFKEDAGHISQILLSFWVKKEINSFANICLTDDGEESFSGPHQALVEAPAIVC